jgi:RHS repeat-associated protein
LRDNGNRITDFDFTYLNGPSKKNQSNYRYDKTSQLINASYTFMPDESYQYDPNGNRTQATIHDQKISYKTASHNRLISDNNNRYEYDLEGNRTKSASKDGEIKYYWDNRNRLIKIETPRGTIEYFYDYLNRLVLRKQGETTITFIHDGWQIILQFDNDKPTHRYLWGTKQDELICDNDNWTLNDHLNTIRDIVKSDGTVAAHLEYNSFGKIISATKNDSSLQFTYTGKLTDKVSELQWNINRWYDAKVGRWVSEDPIGVQSKETNFCRYAKNDSISLHDPLGLVCTTFAPTRYCCKKFIQVYSVGYASVNDCVNDIITSTWWGNYASSAGTAIDIPLVLIASKLAQRLGLAVSLSIILGKYWAADTVRNYCQLYFCEVSTSQICSCCEGPWFREYWTCSCSGSYKLYSGDADQFYSSVPAGKLTAVTAHLLW